MIGESGGTPDDRRVPLLESPDSNDGQESGPEQPKRLSLLGELWVLMVIAVPVAIASLSRVAMSSTDLAFLGKLGTKYLSAGSLANVWTWIFNPFAFAPANALNTLCSQAIGAGNKKLAGIWLQLAVVAGAIALIPVLLSYVLTKPVVMAATDGDEEVAHLAETFAYVSMVGILPSRMYYLLRQFFQALEIVQPAMYVCVFAVGVNALLNACLVPPGGKLSLGFVGSPLATASSETFQLGVFSWYVMYKKRFHEPYWGGWTRDCFQKERVKAFMHILIPAAISSFMEDTGFIITNLATGPMGRSSVSANAVLESLISVLWAAYWGMGLSLQVRVGYFLGAGDIKSGKQVMYMSLVLVSAIVVLVSFGCYVFRYEVSRWFSEDEEVIEEAARAMSGMIFLYAAAIWNLCAVNILDAMAQQRILAWTLTIGMWLVGTPCSLLFAYKTHFFADNQVAGLWFGAGLGELFKGVVLWAYLWRIDWHAQSKDARLRSEVETADSNANDEQHDGMLTQSLLGENPITLSPAQSSPRAQSISAHSPLLRRQI